ncbi:baseplate J protein [Sphingomonas sp. HMWF008]|nr:baseplate J protein [Sphingomonas sp. HMWF008]
MLNVLARIHAGAVDGLYGALDDVANFLPDRAEKERLARWASIFGLTRKAAEAASGSVVLTGSDVTVPAGTALTRADGARYILTADATLDDGTATAAVAAEGAGTAGAMATGQLLTFLSPVAGVQATATVAAPGIVGGVEEESDDALRARLLLRIRNPVRGGSASDYVVWAREVAEVTRAWVYENASGLGTVSVLFVCDGRSVIIPDSDDVARVAAYIADRRPVCAAVTVAAPVAAPIAFTIALTPDTAEVRAAVTAELADLIAREGEPGGTMLISHMREAISLAAGETDHVLTVPSGNFTPSAGHIPTLGAITWA